MEIVSDLEKTVFALDHTEKQVGEDVTALLHREKNNGELNDSVELEMFHVAALKLGITSTGAALMERRALKKLIERAQNEEDKRKESIVAALLNHMRKYSKFFRSDVSDDTDSQGSNPTTSPTIACEANGRAFERHFSKRISFNLNQNRTKSGNMPAFPEEFRCPISLQLMYDPVVISSGQTYERVCIEKWFKDGHDTCPKTQQRLSHLGVTPNYCVKGLISTWCENHGVAPPDGPPESLDLNNWRLAQSNSCELKEVKAVALEEEERDDEGDDSGRYESWMSTLSAGESWNARCKTVEDIRFLLKDDAEARVYIGANGFVEVLLEFLKMAIEEGDEREQEVGAMALFNLVVNNNRNKSMLLSGGVIPLLEKMISNPTSCEPAAALYLNLSCFADAKPIIGSSDALPALVRLLRTDSPQSMTCKHDALHALFNLSTHRLNIPSLLAANIIGVLTPLLASDAWAEKVLAVFMNLLSVPDAKAKLIATPEFVSSLVKVLDNGERFEQEQAVSCLLIICSADENCSHLVLEEGVIPALVSLTANGTAKGKEKAQKLLKLFREQRQREQCLSLPRDQQCSLQAPPEIMQRAERMEVAREPKSEPITKTRSTRRLGKTISSFWKGSKSFSFQHQPSVGK